MITDIASNLLQAFDSFDKHISLNTQAVLIVPTMDGQWGFISTHTCVCPYNINMGDSSSVYELVSISYHSSIELVRCLKVLTSNQQ